ncbi:MAG: hypothetical protein ACK4NR_03540 [Micavibrio sp.]
MGHVFSWVSLAVVAAIFQAAMPLVSEHFKVNTMHMIVWLRIISVAAVSPLVMLYGLPSDPIYYLSIVGVIIMVAVTDLIYFGSAARNGAGVTTRVQPFEVFATFFLWTIVTPSLMQSYFDTPWRSLWMILALSGCVYFALRMQHHDISRRTFRTMLPVIGLGALMIVLSKTAMNHSPPHSGVYGYIFLQGMGVLLVYGILMRFWPAKFPTMRKDKAVLKAGLFMAICSLGHLFSKYYAFKMVVNPAYVTVVGLTAPLWVWLYYKLVKRPDNDDVVAGFGVVICAVVLIILTRL